MESVTGSIRWAWEGRVMEPTTDEGPQLRLHRSANEGFVPLQLILQPAGLVLEVHESEVLVGRHSEAGLRLPLPDVSRRHCRLSCSAGVWTITDLNSLNGIQVNGQSVAQATLENGDQVRIGGFTFAVHIGQAGHVHSILQTLKRKAS
jgi:pSer/pThr/pTyr-binding forkhead associated (FHA) protein